MEYTSIVRGGAIFIVWAILFSIFLIFIVKNINKVDKNDISMQRYVYGYIKITIFVVILVSLILILLYGRYLFFEVKGVSNGNRLTALISFIAPILGFSGTYLIFNLTNIEQREKEKQYYQDMLFGLLRYSMEETESIIILLYNKFNILSFVENLEEKETPGEEHSRLLEKIEELRRNDKKIYEEFQDILDENLKYNLVYDTDWTKYLNYEEHDNRQNIINWLNILRNRNLDVSSFISLRNIIATILKIKEIKLVEIGQYTEKIKSNDDLIKDEMKIYAKCKNKD